MWVVRSGNLQYTCTHAHTHSQKHTDICSDVQTAPWLMMTKITFTGWLHVYMWHIICTYVTCITCMCMHVYVCYMCTCTYVCTISYVRNMHHMYVYVCMMYVCYMCTCWCIYHMYVTSYVCIMYHMYVYVCMYVCMYVTCVHTCMCITDMLSSVCM